MHNLVKQIFRRPVGGFTPTTFTVPAGVKSMNVLLRNTFDDEGFYPTFGFDQYGNCYSWGQGPTGNGAAGNVTNATDNTNSIMTSASAIPLKKPFLGADGAVINWGQNAFGQVGGGGTVNANNPVLIGTFSGIRIKKVFRGNTCYALSESGNLYAWGFNGNGQVGDGTLTNRDLPVLVLADVVDFWQDSQTYGPLGIFAKTSNNNIYGWGADQGGFGSLGNGTTGGQVSPTLVTTAGLNFVKVERSGRTGNPHTLFLTDDGKIYACGLNSSGQLGDGTNLNRLVPTLTTGAQDWADIAAGQDFSMGLKKLGTVLTWGEGGSGQQGSGALADRTSPTGIVGVSGAGSKWVKIYAAGQTAYAVNDNGRLYGWGAQTASQPVLGMGATTTNQSTPVVVGLITGTFNIPRGVVAMAKPLDGFAVHCITDRGTRYAWGNNALGGGAALGMLGTGSVALSNATPDVVDAVAAFVGPQISGNILWKVPTTEPVFYERSVTPGQVITIAFPNGKYSIPELGIQADQFIEEIEFQWSG